MRIAKLADHNIEHFIDDEPDDGPDPWAPGGINYARSMLDAVGYLRQGDLAAVFRTYGRSTPTDILDYLPKSLEGDVPKPVGKQDANARDIFLLVTYYRRLAHHQAAKRAGTRYGDRFSPSDLAGMDTATAFNRAFHENVSGDRIQNMLIDARRRKPQGVLRSAIAPQNQSLSEAR